jgi:3D-(3,5/4)-trihydroxycyclohexane-1,2-dione acylhydrolase (decyclizing)
MVSSDHEKGLPMPTAPTLRLTMAQALVKHLQVQFSERDGRERRLIPALFGIFGHGNVAGLGQALFEYGQDLPFHQPRNEQSMVHTAIGFARAVGRAATLACAASIGPGSTNMLTGAATATVNRVPVLLLPADYYATRHQGPVLQQLEHPISADVSVNDAFRPLSRFFDRLTRPEHLLTALPEAMRVLTDPAETGAVTLSLPQDIQAHAYDYPAHFFEKRVWRIERRLPDPRRIAEAVDLLRAARRPAILAGGGVHYAQAWEELQAFAEAVGLPVGETLSGKGAIRRATPLLVGGFGVTGNPAASSILSQADLVLCIGTRLTDFSTGSMSAFQNPAVRFISLNVTGHDAYKLGALPIVADAREGLRALGAAAREAGLAPDPAYAQEIAAANAAWVEQQQTEIFIARPGEAMSQGQLIGAMNAEAQAGDVILTAAGGPPGDLHELWDATGDRRCLIEFGFSCMGHEMPAGLGVRLAQPEGEVVVFIGDGTYLMNPTELVTALQEGLKITIVIAQNHGFQIIRRLQMARAGRSFGNEFRARDQATNRLEGDYLPIDLVRNAESMGARTWHVFTPDAVRQALREARAETRACVIVAEIEKHRYLPGGGVWWDVAPAEVTQDGVTQELRAAYEEERAKLQRLYY